jgi:hypothetical protein
MDVTLCIFVEIRFAITSILSKAAVKPIVEILMSALFANSTVIKNLNAPQTTSHQTQGNKSVSILLPSLHVTQRNYYPNMETNL